MANINPTDSQGANQSAKRNSQTGSRQDSQTKKVHHSYQKRHEDYLRLVRKLTRISDLFMALCVLIPLIFFNTGGKSVVLSVATALVVVFAIFIWRSRYVGSISHEHSLITIILLGMTIGLAQLSPIPTLALSFTAIFALLGVSFVYQIIFSFACFLSVLVFYLLADKVFGLSQSQTLLFEVSAISGFFFTVGMKYYFLQIKYEDMHLKLDASRERFDEFMHISNKLARYTPAQVWQLIVHGKSDAKLENKRKKITIFFSDIVGFTDLSEKLSPEDLTTFLNTYFEQMSVIAKRHGGTIDKFIGDALLVFFGDPTSKGLREDALACVEMALDMRREMTKLRNHWRGLGFEGLDVRMGINTGYCHVGNFGSLSRLSYTAIGREVNLAARIQSVAKPNQVLMARSTFELVYHNFVCKRHKPVMLKGILEPVDVVEVIGVRQGESKRNVRWVEHDLPGFNLHLNMREIKPIDKTKIRHYLREASQTLDERIQD